MMILTCYKINRKIKKQYYFTMINLFFQSFKTLFIIINKVRISIRLKSSLFKRIIIRPTIIYKSKCWAVERKIEQKMNEAEIRILRLMSGMTLKTK